MGSIEHQQELNTVLEEIQPRTAPPATTRNLLPVLFGENPAPVNMLSSLVPRLHELLLSHGDMVVQVGGNDLDSITPTIWTEEDKRSAGADLRNCVHLEGVYHG